MRLILVLRRVNGKLIMKKILNIILTVLAWMFGIAFAIGSISELFNGNILFAITLLIGSLLLLPPIKKLIIKRIPKLSRWMITMLGSVIILSSFGIFAPNAEPKNTVVAKDDKQVVEQIDSDVETAWGKPIVPAENNTPVPVIQQPQALLSQQDDKIKDVSSIKPKINEVEVIDVPAEPKPESEPVRLAEVPSNDDCSGLPRTCGAMANCAQAKKALACGNGRLDRDNDGIPCESIC